MGLFEVQASEPYIHFSNNTGISVQRGQMSLITPTNLSIETNLDVEDKDVRFIINEAPMYGKIKKNMQEKSRLGSKLNFYSKKRFRQNITHDVSVHKH